MYGATSNGHVEYSERYGTRCATGVIPRKRYDKVYTDEDDDDDGEFSERRPGRRDFPPRKNCDSELATAPPSSAAAANGSDGDSVATGSSSRSSDSGSDTEEYSDGGGPAQPGRLTRSNAPRPAVTNGHVRTGRADVSKYRTRNQGRRTVHYEEADSDVDDTRRMFERRRTEIGSRARLCRN